MIEKQIMSFTTILGILGAFGLFIGSLLISTDNWAVFISLSSLIMVVGGTFAATFISYEPRYVMLACSLIWKIFLFTSSFFVFFSSALSFFIFDFSLVEVTVLV